MPFLNDSEARSPPAHGLKSAQPKRQGKETEQHRLVQRRDEWRSHRIVGAQADHVVTLGTDGDLLRDQVPHVLWAVRYIAPRQSVASVAQQRNLEAHAG